MSGNETPNAKLEELRSEIVRLTLFEVRRHASDGSAPELSKSLAEAIDEKISAALKAQSDKLGKDITSLTKAVENQLSKSTPKKELPANLSFDLSDSEATRIALAVAAAMKGDDVKAVVAENAPTPTPDHPTPPAGFSGGEEAPGGKFARFLRTTRGMLLAAFALLMLGILIGAVARGGGGSPDTAVQGTEEDKLALAELQERAAVLESWVNKAAVGELGADVERPVAGSIAEDTKINLVRTLEEVILGLEGTRLEMEPGLGIHADKIKQFHQDLTREVAEGEDPPIWMPEDVLASVRIVKDGARTKLGLPPMHPSFQDDAEDTEQDVGGGDAQDADDGDAPAGRDETRAPEGDAAQDRDATTPE